MKKGTAKNALIKLNVSTLGLTKAELKLLLRLNTPIKIQNYLDSISVNYELEGQSCMSPRRVMRMMTAHCIEGALFAATALWLAGEEPLLLDLKSHRDEDHVVALYKRNGFWGAISKTNHATLRFRDPIYATVRELAASYFHEFFSNARPRKSLRSHSDPFDMSRYGTSWITAEEELYDIAADLDDAKHYELFPQKNVQYIRSPDVMERKAGGLMEWTEKGKRLIK
jgi:hypothetical protein